MKRKELRICNLDYLYDLAKGDLAFIREMITVFLEEIVPELSKMEEMIGNSDFSSIKQLAHKLRSSIPYVGLDILIGKDLAEMEEMARLQNQMDDIKSNFRKVSIVCDNAVHELKMLEI